MKTLSSTPHRNIIQLLGVCTDAEPLLMILELAGRSDLRSLLIKSKSQTASPTFTPSDLLHFALDIVHGMIFLQTKNVIHRDLACRNCFVADDMTVKIGDFGLSRAASISDYYRKEGLKSMPIRWSPPEVLVNGLFSSSSDVWSFGVVMWEILSFGAEPYSPLHGHDVIKVVTNGNRLHCPEGCDEAIYHVMRQCWSTMPESRPTFPQLDALFPVIVQYATLSSRSSQHRINSFTDSSTLDGSLVQSSSVLYSTIPTTVHSGDKQQGFKFEFPLKGIGAEPMPPTESPESSVHYPAELVGNRRRNHESFV